ncbi:hypothetical protein ACV3UL_15640 [Clostridium perfringens]
MSKVKMTVQQIMDLKLWEKVCEFLNIDEYSVVEGKLNPNDLLEFDSNFEKNIQLDNEYVTYEVYFLNSQGEEEFDSLSYPKSEINDRIISYLNSIFKKGATLTLLRES